MRMHGSVTRSSARPSTGYVTLGTVLQDADDGFVGRLADFEDFSGG